MFYTLRTRLIIAFASVTLISLLVALVGFLFLIRDREISAARERIGQLVDPVAWSVQSLAQQGATEEQIASYLDERANTLQVRFLLLDSNSRILQDSGRQLAGQSLDLSKEKDLRPSGAGPAGFAFVTQEVAGTRQVLFQPSPFLPLQLVTVPNVVPTSYRILMAVPEQNLSAVWRQLATRILIAAGAGLLLAVLLSVWIARSIVRPLARMTRASEEMARGHYQQRIESKRRDEVGRLAAAFNTMAAEVSHSDQMMRDLLANVAHELKTPLTSIQGFSQALTEGAVHSQDEYERADGSLTTKLSGCGALLKTCSICHRSSQGKCEWSMSRSTSRRCCRIRSSALAAGRRKAAAAWSLFVQPDLPLVIGDERRLEQVLANLLDNALRYTPSGGTIRLQAQRQGDQIAIGFTTPAHTSRPNTSSESSSASTVSSAHGAGAMVAWDSPSSPKSSPRMAAPSASAAHSPAAQNSVSHCQSQFLLPLWPPRLPRPFAHKARLKM